ncbi:hypothetical protein COLO4_13986 [Corchorus olitorius]|uniref:Uncharacterized protein n=1 Tax=Corchorus olitorius TaxID=93759 RepID=A0A1R3JTW7_9ROSI|nr:hypothetical protein COLO4_13986 [Corchorus olitorius]
MGKGFRQFFGSREVRCHGTSEGLPSPWPPSEAARTGNNSGINYKPNNIKPECHN